jgi:cation diffusion facilitator CzcD-associated flavoprotein CzcO
MCDTAAMVYLPLLEETGHMPSMKYVFAPEIFAHAKRIATTFGLYDNALFSTQVTELEWDEARRRAGSSTPTAATRSAPASSRWAPGPLHRPKLPGIPGIETFGATRSTPAGGTTTTPAANPEGAPDGRLADKRVGIIGTGATAVQCIPRWPATRGAVRVPAHAVVDRRAQQPRDRPRVVRHARAGLAAASG